MSSLLPHGYFSRLRLLQHNGYSSQLTDTYMKSLTAYSVQNNRWEGIELTSLFNISNNVSLLESA